MGMGHLDALGGAGAGQTGSTLFLRRMPPLPGVPAPERDATDG